MRFLIFNVVTTVTILLPPFYPLQNHAHNIIQQGYPTNINWGLSNSYCSYKPSIYRMRKHYMVSVKEVFVRKCDHFFGVLLDFTDRLERYQRVVL